MKIIIILVISVIAVSSVMILHDNTDQNVIKAVGLGEDRNYIVDKGNSLKIEVTMTYEELTNWVWSTPLLEGIRNDKENSPPNLELIAQKTKDQLISEGSIVLYSDRLQEVDNGHNNLVIRLKNKGDMCIITMNYTKFH